MKTLHMLKNFWREEDGGQVVEWPLIAALLGIAAIAGWGVLDTQVQAAMTSIGTAISGTAGQVTAP